MAEQEEWSANSTESFNILMLKPTVSGPQTVDKFHPQFTYPIFGDEEQIFGYKDLDISLRYRTDDMRPNLQISYSKKFKAIGETEPADVKSILKNHLPPVAFLDKKDFDKTLTTSGADFHPPGEYHTSFERHDGIYEVRKGSLADTRIQQLITRVEILVPFFIEGGSYIAHQPESPEPWKAPEDASRWTVFLLYRKQTSPADATKSEYSFVGYSTVYRFFYMSRVSSETTKARDDWELPKGKFDPSQVPCRSRLSQFIILPPYQAKGIGARLYQTIFKFYNEQEQTVELTVEDPNEAFDDLRDTADLNFLRKLPEFSKMKIDTSIVLPKDKSEPVPRNLVDTELYEGLRSKSKIAPRQFARLIEMHTMSQLPASVQPGFDESKAKSSAADEHQYHLWQLFVKKRIYKQNADVLGQLEPSERLDKVYEALRSVELEYARLVAAAERFSKHYESADESAIGKRKGAPDGGEGQGSAKKSRAEEAA